MDHRTRQHAPAQRQTLERGSRPRRRPALPGNIPLPGSRGSRPHRGTHPLRSDRRRRALPPRGCRGLHQNGPRIRGVGPNPGRGLASWHTLSFDRQTRRGNANPETSGAGHQGSAGLLVQAANRPATNAAHGGGPVHQRPRTLSRSRYQHRPRQPAGSVPGLGRNRGTRRDEPLRRVQWPGICRRRGALSSGVHGLSKDRCHRGHDHLFAKHLREDLVGTGGRIEHSRVRTRGSLACNTEPHP